MLDRTDFASWQQRIRLYCQGKENGVNILKSIDEGPFQMGTFRETLAEGTEGALHLGPERPRVYSDMSPEDKERYNADIRATNILLQGLPRTYGTITKERLFMITMFGLPNSSLMTCGTSRWTMSKNTVELKVFEHEAHANENKMMLERLTQQTVDPLALMSNVSPQHYHSQSSTIPRPQHHQPHSADTSQSDLGLSPTDNLIENLTNTLALLTQSYKTFLPQTNNQLRTSSNPRNQATVQDGRVVVQNVQGRQNRGDDGQARQVKCYNCNGVGHIARNCTQPKRPQNSEYFKDKMLLMQAQENGVVLDEEQLLSDTCDAYDSDVDEAPTAQTMFMENLSSADPVYDEAGPSYDSDILSEVQDHDHFQDAICEHHEEHGMQDDVQPSYVVGSHADYTSDSNMTPYDQYIMIMLEPNPQSVFKAPTYTVADNSLNAELAIYKEQVELYERRARFELTEREQKIDEQLRIVICDRNIKEENLKKELHSVKLQLASTIQHKQVNVDEVTSLKKDFNQKENKYLEEFLDLKALKEDKDREEKLFKQAVYSNSDHMRCN
ncbi:retrovirus-related pol polyprotein from transposon TNT 1-94 [Tanacetum coccineum]